MLKPALIGTGVALLCFVPPLLHFVLGPLGPFIGGFVAGAQERVRDGGVTAPLLVGALIGLFLAVIAGVIGIPTVIIVRSVVDAARASTAFLALIPVLAGVYGATLAIAGAYAGALVRGRGKADVAGTP